ncbi:hypothetical protein ACH5RR_002836 [Cinchona calisaya]|uniref:Uncharacterized protein n=1 Tax=Cinchona calisaya TaxID=153742 RepID=A0ABD3AT45_9GENT
MALRGITICFAIKGSTLPSNLGGNGNVLHFSATSVEAETTEPMVGITESGNLALLLPLILLLLFLLIFPMTTLHKTKLILKTPWGKVEIILQSICKLQNLEYLNFDDTHVMELPSGILKLGKLCELLVDHDHESNYSEKFLVCGFKTLKAPLTASFRINRCR